MKNVGIVQGSAAQAQPIIIGKTTVYIHNNIVEKIDEEGCVYYEYEEIQYPIQEYWYKIQQENATLREAIMNLNK